MKRQQPVGKWYRRFILIAWVGLFLSNIGRTFAGNAVERFISITVMVVCVILFIACWQMPTTDSSHTKDQS